MEQSHRVPMNALGRSVAASREPILEAIERVLDGGMYVQGPEHALFESELAEYLGGRRTLGVASGTDALYLALRAIGPANAGTVLTVANAGGYSSIAATRAGLRVRYVDIDPDTLCISVDSLEQSLKVRSEEIVGVIVTHLYGRMAPVEDVVTICQPLGLSVVEDCAQSLGARRGGKSAGTIGDAAAFSFYPTKNLGALGDGGAVASEDPEIIRQVELLRQYGWDGKYNIVDSGGVNSRLDEIQAAILRVRLTRVDSGNQSRRDIIARYAEAASGGPVRVLSAIGDDHVGHLCVALTEDRDAIRARLLSKGVSTDVHYPVPDYMQPAFRSDRSPMALNVTNWATSRVFSLPCFPEMEADEIDRVCFSLRSLA